MRQALGDARLNLIGYSISTRLAALYLQEFPENSGRVILDGSISPVSTIRDLLVGSLPQQEENLLSLLSMCTTADANCDPNILLSQLTDRVESLAASTTAEDTLEFIMLGQLLLAVAENPVQLSLVALPLIEYIDTLDFNILAPLFGEPDNEPGNGDNESPENDGDMDREDAENETPGIAYLCADDSVRPTAADLTIALDEFNQVSDLFAESVVGEVGTCAGWPAALEPLDPIVTSTAPTSLVFGGILDSNTPIEWSEDMAMQIGGAFVSSNHLGHLSVFLDRSECVDDVAEAFLLDGMAPAIANCQR